MMEGGANHLKGKEGLGGKLALTDKRLIFKSHKLNINNHQESFDRADIASAEAGKTLRLLNDSLTIQLSYNKVHKFIVDEPQEWALAIKGQKVPL